MTHDPKAVEVLADWLLEIDQEQADEDAQELLDALTAADLSIVGEGQARIGGQVVRLEFAGCYDDPDDDRSGVRYEDERCSHGYDTTCTCQPLYVAIPTDEGGET